MPFTKPVIVIDNGSYNIKAGFACDNHPVSIFRTAVGRPKYLNGTYGRGYYDVYIGDDAIARSDELDISHPVVRGKIVHWDNMERIWHHIFYRELKAAPEDRAVMLSCAPPMPLKDKLKCCEVFFETLNVPALCVKPQSVLALYGSGCTTGISVDLGHDITEIQPIYEGGNIGYANMLTNFAGAELLDYVQESLTHREVTLGPDPTSMVSGIKKFLYLTENCAVPRNRSEYEKKYILPSGEEVLVGDEVFMSSEMYFQPDLVTGKKTDYLPIQEALVTTVMKCDSELQTELYDAIVTHGGMATIPGFNKRLAKEVEAIINRPVNIIQSTEAYAVAWMGGATFAGITEARKIWVFKKQYEDEGEKIIRHRF